MKKVLMILPREGFEEVEAVTPVDYLRRAGSQVTVAADASERRVVGAHGIVIEADRTLEEVEGLFDAVLLPGGLPGARYLAESERVGEILRAHDAEKKIIGAICAAPTALDRFGLLHGKKFTAYPGCEEGLDGQYVGGRVVRDTNIVTAEGPSRAIDFALALVEILHGAEMTQKLRRELLLSIEV